MDVSTIPMESEVNSSLKPNPSMPVSQANNLPEKNTGNTKKRLLISAFIIVVALFLVFISLSKLQSNNPGSKLPSPTSEILPTPTTIQNRKLSPIATDSAFLDLKNSLNNLTNELNITTAFDEGLSPPSLVLPLGLTK